MGIDCTILVVDYEFDDHMASHTRLPLDGDPRIHEALESIPKQTELFKPLNCYESRCNDEPAYGMCREDDYGEPLVYARAVDVAKAIQSVPEISRKNVAVAAYLMQLPTAKVCLYWT